MLKTCYKKANSKESFFELLNGSGVPTYERSGKITGVLFKGYKFRFSRIGFTEERINELDKSIDRHKELEQVRSKRKKEIGIERE